MKMNRKRAAGKAALVSIAVAASTALTSGSALAAVVCGPATNISIPNTFAGVYINFVTGVTATTTAGAPGWDFGPWGSSNTLAFFFPSTPTNSHGAVASATTGPYLVLAPGTPISAASTYAAVTATTATAALQAGVTGALVGFRLYNESTSAINYGWAEFNTTAPLGFPATITRYCYQNDGTEITAGTTPVSLQNFSVD
ncbi:MAG: hypothetical protein J0L88_10115 [Xanthomonadales bacterium]|nr:hypothetical protein [Xanthomonadales bacterium]